MGINFILFHEEKLVEIREKFIKAINKILNASEGKPFYGKIFLYGNNNYLMGLIRKLKVGRRQIMFDLIEERVKNNKIVKNVRKEKINFGQIKRIEVYETQDRRPIFIGENEQEEKEEIWNR